MVTRGEGRREWGKTAAKRFGVSVWGAGNVLEWIVVMAA